MPISVPDLAILRSFPQTVKRYISVEPQDVVFQGQVTDQIFFNPSAGSIHSFEYDNETGDFEDVLPEMTISFGNSPGGRELGTTRVRLAATSDTMYIDETAYTWIVIANNVYFTVYNEFRPWPKKPRLEGIQGSSGYYESFTEYHDYDIEYEDQNDLIIPQCNITNGSGYAVKLAGFLDDGENFRTVILSVEDSEMYADGATKVGQTWDVGDGTITVGDASSETITVTFPEGFRYVSVEIEDSNGKTAIGRTKIWAHGDTYPPIVNFEVTRDETSDGRLMSFKFHGANDSLSESSFPRGTGVCYWEIAKFGPSQDDAPPDYRSHFSGWVLKDATMISKTASTYTIDVGGIAAWLNEFGGFAFTIRDEGTEPETWYEMNDITLDRVAHYILREYTNVLQICNFYASGHTGLIRAEDVKRESPWSQLISLYKGGCIVVGADSLNQMRAIKHFSYLSDADRASRPVFFDLQNTDWKHANPPTLNNTSYVPRVGWVDMYGSTRTFLSFYNALIRVNAPTQTPGWVKGREEGPFQRLEGSGGSAPTILAELASRHLARLNRIRDDFAIDLIGNFDVVEPFLNPTVSLDYSLGNISGLDVDELYIPVKISVRHSNELGRLPKSVSMTFEQVTQGTTSAIVSIIDQPIVPPDYTNPWDIFPIITPVDPNLTSNLLHPDQANIGIAFANSIYVTGNYLDVVPTWVQKSLPMDGGESGTDAVQVPGVPTRIAYATNTKLRVYGNVTSTPTEDYTNTFTTASSKRAIEIGRLDPNWICVISATTSGILYQGSQDGGVTIDNEVLIGASGDSTGLPRLPSMCLDENVPGVAYCHAWNGSAFRLFKTTTFGASWSPATEFNGGDVSLDLVGGSVPLPLYLLNPFTDPDIMYFCLWTVVGAVIARVTRSGTVAHITATTGMSGHAGGREHRSMGVNDSDPNQLLVAFYNPGNNRSTLHKSDDKGDSWTAIQPPTAGENGSPFWIARFGGDGQSIYTGMGSAGGFGTQYFAPNINNVDEVADLQDKADVGNVATTYPNDFGFNIFGF